MQTLSRSPASAAASPRKPGAAKPQYPELPEGSTSDCTDSPLFWLCVWLRDVAQAEALQAHAVLMARQPDGNPILYHALFSGASALSQESRKTLNYLRDLGGLLYAWNGTTKTHEVAA